MVILGSRVVLWKHVFDWPMRSIPVVIDKIVKSVSRKKKKFTPCFPHSFKPNEGVVIIGATNFPEALDKWV